MWEDSAKVSKYLMELWKDLCTSLMCSARVLSVCESWESSLKHPSLLVINSTVNGPTVSFIGPNVFIRRACWKIHARTHFNKPALWHETPRRCPLESPHCITMSLCESRPSYGKYYRLSSPSGLHAVFLCHLDHHYSPFGFITVSHKDINDLSLKIQLHSLPNGFEICQSLRSLLPVFEYYITECIWLLLS